MSKLMIFEQKNNEIFELFIRQCSSFPKINIDVVKDMAKASIHYVTANKIDRKEMPNNQLNILQEQWYKSLSKGNPDYSVYGEDAYLGELWACWAIYSRKYLNKIYTTNILNNIGKITKIVDLGCGFAYTTTGLKQIYPEATVIGTNLENTIQMDLARQMAISHGFEMAPSIRDIKGPIDILIAWEYFEHIVGPVHHLKDIISRLNPRILILANTFNAKSIGHFDFYNINNNAVIGKKVSKIFNNELKINGYRQIKTNFWNNRPNFWIKNE